MEYFNDTSHMHRYRPKDVSYARTATLASQIFELLPFVRFFCFFFDKAAGGYNAVVGDCRSSYSFEQLILLNIDDGQ